MTMSEYNAVAAKKEQRWVSLPKFPVSFFGHDPENARRPKDFSNDYSDHKFNPALVQTAFLCLNYLAHSLAAYLHSGVNKDGPDISVHSMKITTCWRRSTIKPMFHMLLGPTKKAGDFSWTQRMFTSHLKVVRCPSLLQGRRLRLSIPF